MGTKKKATFLCVSLSQELRQGIKAAARAAGLSVSAFAREIFSEQLERVAGGAK